jgi:hypothetical protein
VVPVDGDLHVAAVAAFRDTVEPSVSLVVGGLGNTVA